MWTYVIDPKRAAALSVETAFESIAERIVSEMNVLCRHIQPCHDMGGFKRAAYCISVTPSTFDAFFNSEFGYRGAYFRSPYEGLSANDKFLRLLQPRLLEWASRNGGSDLDFDAESLSTPSAKAWLAESGGRLCDQCDGEWTHPQDDAPEIRNGRWEPAADVRGRKAPFGAKIRIFGAFLSERHDEFISWRKRHRAREIYEGGWS